MATHLQDDLLQFSLDHGTIVQVDNVIGHVTQLTNKEVELTLGAGPMTAVFTRDQIRVVIG